jgi:lysophospholipase L1-like esterase
MKKSLIAIATLLLFSFMVDKPKKTTIFLAGDSTMSIKETKAFPETGWGMPFVYFWDSSINVINTAKNGRSTKSFILEGIWQSIVNQAAEGDYVMIQFGHNDEVKEKTDRYTTPDEYKNNLTKFIKETREKKAIPILLTPVSRRKFDEKGIALQTHEIYSGLVREVAEKNDVILIDMDKKSIQLFQKFGVENSNLLFLKLKPGEHPNYPDGKDDNTHFNELGARLVAQLMLEDVNNKIPALAQHLIKPKQK